jgi:hypothetical protein
MKLPTHKPTLPLPKNERDALSAFLAVHRRIVAREMDELADENQLLRQRLAAIKERETLKFR